MSEHEPPTIIIKGAVGAGFTSLSRQVADAVEANISGMTKASRRTPPLARGGAEPKGNALLTPQEAAQRLGITVDQLKAFVRDGHLTWINMGRGIKRPRYRFTEADINTMIEKRKQLEAPCLSTNQKNPHHTSGSISRSTVVGFMALRAARLAAKRKE